MTIPSTKASTEHVDSGNDLISNARADIKQNIDNVNEIIDHLGTVNKVPATLSSSVPGGAYLDYYENISGTTYRRLFTAIDDIDGIITAADDSAGAYYEFTLAAGTYRAYWFPSVQHEDFHSITLYNKTDASSILNISSNEIGTTAEGVSAGIAKSFTIADTKTFEFRFSTGSVLQDGIAGTINLEIQQYR